MRYAVGRPSIPQVRRRSRRTVARALLCAPVLAAVACQGGQGRSGDSVGRSLGDTGPGAAAPDQPRIGGILAQRLPTDPDRLDLHQSTTYASVWPTAPCFNQLVQFDPLNPQDQPDSIIPDLAERWEQPDPATMIFFLKNGIAFHDGQALTSDDVKVQLDWIRNPPPGKISPRRGALGTIASIETPSPGLVRVNLTRPNPSLLMNLASHHFTIGQSRDIITNGEVSQQLIGTGPFIKKNYQRSVVIELARNASYHVAGRPFLDGLAYYIEPVYSSALANFIAGQYDMLYDLQLSVSDTERIARTLGPAVQTHQTPTTQRDTVFVNARRVPYNDLRVRRAISLALDRDAAITVVRQGAARRGGYMAPTGVWAIPQRELRDVPGYDLPNVTEARQLLAQAGVTTPLRASAITRTDYKDVAEFAKDQLAKIGIDLSLRLADAATAQPMIQRGDFDIAPWVIGINVDDPDATFSEIATSRAVRNWSGVTDPLIDALYEKQSQLMEFRERRQAVQELERVALSLHQLAVLSFQDANAVNTAKLRNYVYHGSQSTNRRMESVWLEP